MSTTMDDTEQLSIYEGNMSFYFVTVDGKQHDDLTDLNYCFECMAQRFVGLDNTRWISEPECIRLASGAPLTRQSVFLFATFGGAAFDRLRQTKALIFGPKCVIDSYINNTQIPNLPSPVFCVTLRDQIVCTSGLKAADKQLVQQLVQYMGGQFFANDLTASTTYLVTNTTMSVKYEKAVQYSIRTVTLDWVHRLWALSQTENFVLTAETDEPLYTAHRIPIFHRLGITSTGIGVAERQKLKALIEANGGSYHGSFKSELIDILMVARSQTDSDKFRAAVKCRKSCLTPEWFRDSVQSGFALPIEEYRVVEAGSSSSGGGQPLAQQAKRNRPIPVSTPTKAAAAAAASESVFNADCTNLSEIMGNVTVNESRMSMSSATGEAASRAADKAYKVVLANINVQQAKRSGAFLDGCNVYLCGFTADEKDKLDKILSTASATRFAEYDSRVEYVLCGAPSAAELQLLGEQAAGGRAAVTLQWLCASIEQKCPAAERQFAYSLPAARRLSPEEAAGSGRAGGSAATVAGVAAAAAAAAAAAVTASPASKKNMASMSSSFRKPQPQPRRLQLDEEQLAQRAQAEASADANLVQQYLVAPAAAAAIVPVQRSPATSDTSVESRKAGSDRQPADTTEAPADSTDNPQYLAGLTFFVEGFTAESEEALVEDIELAGGKMVSARFRGVCDYVIVPMDIFRPDEVRMRGRQMVNEHWVADTAQEQRCVEVAYYHRPFEWQDEENTPLAGMHLVLTTYSGSERIYLTSIGRILGADVQERYIKTQRPVLICPRPEGAKYNGAIKWSLPVVSCDWLLECARRAAKVAMRPYLVGASVAPADEPEEAEEAAAPPAEPKFFASRSANLSAGSTDSLQITDAQRSPTMAAPPAATTSSAATKTGKERTSAVRTPTETSIDRLKRLRPDDFGGSVQTPLLKHRRLSELAGGVDSPFGGAEASQSPQADDYEANLRKRCVEMGMATPIRETVCRELMNVHETETPETRRRLDAISTPDLIRSPIPVEFRTPACEQRYRDNRNQHYLGPIPSPAPTTPFAEIQRRFWKKALGDDYISPSQTPFTQTQDANSHRPHQQQQPKQRTSNDPPKTPLDESSSTQADFAAGLPSATSTQQPPTAPLPTSDAPSTTAHSSPAANTHVKRLSDFIATNKNTPLKPATAAGTAANLHQLPIPAATQTQLPLAAGSGSQFPGAAGTSEPADAVGWRDPADFYDEHRFRSRNTMQHVGVAKFHISCPDAVRLERLTAQIVQLGGRVCETRGGYDPSCTHVLCEQPTRSEKIFSAIAAGKWLLRLRYVEDSSEAGAFLNEEAYEFGNPLAAAESGGGGGAGGDGVVDETGRAAFRWRKQLQSLRQQQQQRLEKEREAGGGGGAEAGKAPVIGVFSAFRVILHTAKNKVPFRNLLEAGGGVVLDVTEPYESSKDALTATHCILDTRNKLSSTDRKALQRAGVACVNISFLQAYVSSDTAPDPKDFAA